MRIFLTVLLVLSIILAIAITILDPTSTLAPIFQVGAIAAGLALGLVWAYGRFGKRRVQPPRSQVAEIERLYFRAMREMLTDHPNYTQVVNDLQRILSIDPRYKNARHFMQRAMLLRRDDEQGIRITPERTRAEFQRLQEQLVDLDPGIRKSVVMDLIQFGESAVDPLIALLMDEDADVRVHAATALGWIGGKEAVPPLLVALSDDDMQVRRYAARAMCWVVDSSAVEGLISSLDDEDSYVRCYAARALGWSQDERAIEPLTELLNDDNADVREYAATALLDLGQQVTP